MNLLRGISNDQPLMEWLTKFIFPAEAKNVSPAFVRAGTDLACLEMIRGGTTTFADMYYYESDVAASVDKAGLRAVLGETWLDFPAPGHANLEESKTVTRAFLEKWKGHPRVTAAIAPHAPYTCSRETLLAARALADEYGAPLLTHVSETQDEQKQILEKYGKSPAAWLDEIGFLGPRLSIGARRLALARGPEAPRRAEGQPLAQPRVEHEARLGHRAGRRRPEGGRRRRPRDGRRRRLEQRPRHVRRDGLRREAREGGGPRPDAAHRRPSSSGWRRSTARRRSASTASSVRSSRGRRADLIVVELENSHAQPVFDLPSTVVYASRAGDVSLTVVDGKVLWDGRARPDARRGEGPRRGEGVAGEGPEVARREQREEMSLIVRTIVKKRDGGELSEGEIQDFVDGVTDRTVTDEQAAALLMAICCRGMTTAETAALTFAMMRSGDTWDLLPHGFVADKHSTGGVGDKSTLVLAPLLAACGVKTGMMSGRGLGHTGGTLDKLEAIPGFVTGQSREAFDRLLETVGCALIAATDTVAPADRRLYALRDVTGTVESIPLITASILSKKLATGAHAVVFDVKTGNGAFMQKPEDAHVLGRALVDTTRATGRKASGYVTAMDRPVGVAVGNANEVEESIRLLRGDGPADLRENVLLLGADLLVAAGVDGIGEGRPEAAQRGAPGRHRARDVRPRHRGAGREPGRLRRPHAPPAARREARRQGVRRRDDPARRHARAGAPLDRDRLRPGPQGRRRRPGLGLPRPPEDGGRRGRGRAAPRRRARSANDAAGRLPRPGRGLLRDRLGRGRRGAAPVRRREALGTARRCRPNGRRRRGPVRTGRGAPARPGGALARPDLDSRRRSRGAPRRSASGSSGRSAGAP